MKKKNLYAKDLRSPKYRQRVVSPKKGKSSYDRKKLKKIGKILPENKSFMAWVKESKDLQ